MFKNSEELNIGVLVDYTSDINSSGARVYFNQIFPLYQDFNMRHNFTFYLL